MPRHPHPIQNKFRAVATAAMATFLMVEITGAMAFASVFLTLRASEAMLERWGLVTAGWGGAHAEGLVIAAAVPTAIAAAAIAVWFYRRAYAAERAFAEGGR